jgi:hypothetical protein
MVMPLKPEELSPEQKLYEIIEKVVIIKGAIPSDPCIWEFHIESQILKVDAEKLESMSPFRKQYLKVFDRPAPKVKCDRWPFILEALAEDKAESIQAPEESEHVFIAREIFESICEREVSDMAEDALSGMTLFKHEHEKDKQVYFSMPSNILKEIVDNSGFKIPLNKLSEAMSELGFKKAGTDRVWYNGIQKRSWCFIPEAILTEKGG